MMAAVAAIGCLAPVTVTGAECVAKSYPDFCTFCYATIEINSHDVKFV